MHAFRLLPVALVAGLLPLAAHAQDAAPPPAGWTGTGELGFALSRGNSRSENLNAKLAFGKETEQWKHDWYLSALRSKGDVTGDFDGDGVEETKYDLTANRYEAGASSAYKFDPRNYVVGALRYENDDFSPYEYQGTFSVGYGRVFVKNDRTSFSGEIGPGYRRAREADSGEVQSGIIGRGKLDFAHKLTDNTSLVDTLVVESGSDNTYARNLFGVQVAVSKGLAMKAGLETRYNSRVDGALRKTDNLTTVNLVYDFK